MRHFAATVVRVEYIKFQIYLLLINNHQFLYIHAYSKRILRCYLRSKLTKQSDCSAF
jgi:hypothetical protein